MADNHIVVLGGGVGGVVAVSTLDDRLAAGLSRIDPDALAAMVDGDGVSAEGFADPPDVGLHGIVHELRDPDVRQGLGVVFLLLNHLGSNSSMSTSETSDR